MWFETRLKSWKYTLALVKLLKAFMNWFDFKIEVWIILNLKSNSNKIHNNKNKSQSNGKKPFYYFDIDSYTRVITMIYYKRIKRKELQIWIVLLQTKIKIKSYINSYLYLFWFLALLISSICKTKQIDKQKSFVKIKM